MYNYSTNVSPRVKLILLVAVWRCCNKTRFNLFSQKNEKQFQTVRTSPSLWPSPFVLSSLASWLKAILISTPSLLLIFPSESFYNPLLPISPCSLRLFQLFTCHLFPDMQGIPWSLFPPPYSELTSAVQASWKVYTEALKLPNRKM